jgi:hypothetical protein
MKAFHFSSERVLNWRRLQLEIEENKFKQQAAALAAVDRARAELEAQAIGSEVQVRAWASVSGRDLAALAGLRLYVRKESARLATLRSQCRRTLDVAQQALLEARRRCRLLERLKERRFAEWRLAAGREVEQLAAESHLAALARRR